MNFNQLTEAKHKLGFTETKMAKLLMVGLSTFKGWKTRGKVPDYIKASVEAHLLLSKKSFSQLMNKREI